jgi:hypothetical protein
MTGWLKLTDSQRKATIDEAEQIFELEYDCRRFPNFDNISLDWLEDRMMDRLHH